MASAFRIWVAAGWLSLGASACFQSHADRAAAPHVSTDAGPSRDASVSDARVDNAGSAGSAMRLPDAAMTRLTVVQAFEQALRLHCTCRGGLACDDAWNEQFDGASQACVARALEEAEILDCAEQGVREITACLLGSDCMQCRVGLLIEDTPLGDLVEEYCPREQASAYVRLLRASASCTRATSP